MTPRRPRDSGSSVLLWNCSREPFVDSSSRSCRVPLALGSSGTGQLSPILLEVRVVVVPRAAGVVYVCCESESTEWVALTAHGPAYTRATQQPSASAPG